MNYKIVVDSCGLTEEMKQSGYFESVAMSIELEGSTIVDDETFDQADFLKRIAASGECPKSSCPSPERYMESYAGEAERVYVVTLTAELSGSYNSAVLGKICTRRNMGRSRSIFLTPNLLLSGKL